MNINLETEYQLQFTLDGVDYVWIKGLPLDRSVLYCSARRRPLHPTEFPTATGEYFCINNQIGRPSELEPDPAVYKVVTAYLRLTQ